jgi:hypothetical protein
LKGMKYKTTPPIIFLFIFLAFYDGLICHHHKDTKHKDLDIHL